MSDLMLWGCRRCHPPPRMKRQANRREVSHDRRFVGGLTANVSSDRQKEARFCVSEVSVASVNWSTSSNHVERKAARPARLIIWMIATTV